jgi:hypothetical protein
MVKKLMITAVVGAATVLVAMMWSDHSLNRPLPQA